ncbi:carbohydrate deacetylase [Lutimonas vermicola]|uniref:ChbG/HpnK family deacetylase n=1 Tax=Lutimonas vermicola TaxID=414288 RepID=A0ABU9L408_9FLAO
MKSIIVTADDLGLDPSINRGILEAYKNGLVTCSALLMNAPSTDEGIAIAKDNPGLEVGIHLSIVEGFSLRNIHSTITSKTAYFENGICLRRDWHDFLKCYLKGNINFKELEEEFELQIGKFKSHFNTIPFLNSTQHLHLLPGIWKIVLKLCKRHEINYVRLPKMTFPDRLWLNKRMFYLLPFSILGSYCRFSLRNTQIQTTDFMVGMQFSGSVTVDRLKFILSNLRTGTSEIMLHPGYHSDYLVKQLPTSYNNFLWEDELKAATSLDTKFYIESNKINLLKFSDVNTTEV